MLGLHYGIRRVGVRRPRRHVTADRADTARLCGAYSTFFPNSNASFAITIGLF